MNTGDHAAGEAEIRQVIPDCYSEGHFKSDRLLYEEILHPEWRFFLFDEHGQLRIVDRDEYNPSRRKRAPIWPGSVQLSASSKIRSLYSAENLRRLALGTTSGCWKQSRRMAIPSVCVRWT